MLLRHRLDGPRVAARPVRRRRSSGSAWPSSSSSAGCSSRSCPATPCCSRWGCSSPANRSSVIPGPPFVDLVFALVLLTVAAFLGNVVGYEIGRKIGPPLYERNGRILKRKYFDQTTAFFDKHGNKALVIGRFVPFVRTYITVVAGVTQMDRRRFFVWSPIGAVLWVVSITLLGYFLGQAFPWPGREHRLRDPRASWCSRSSRSPTSGGGTATTTTRRPTAEVLRSDVDVASADLLQPPERAASRSALVSTGRTSRPTSASGFSAPGERSIAQTTDLDDGPGLAQRARRVADRAAGGDDVLDQRDPSAGHVGPLGQLAGAVVLGLLAHEQRRCPVRALSTSRSGCRRARGRRAARCRRARGRPSARRPAPAGRARTRRGTCRSTPTTPAPTAT